jgi:ABC-type spermidine/putrescine transport system permease subunit I
MRRTREWLDSAPSFLWLTAFVLVPLVMIFAIAFKPAAHGGEVGAGWSLDAVRALLDPSYLVLLWRTVWVSVVVTVLCLSLALPVAYAMARMSPAWRARMLLLVIVPFWTNFVIRVFAWQQILHAQGWLAEALRATGLLGENERLLGGPFAVILVSVYTYLPFAILPLFAAAEKFDFGLMDAARDLGAKAMTAFTSVFLPGIRQGLVTAFIIIFIPMLGSYVVPDMVGGADSQMIGNKIAQRNFSDRNLPQAAALSAALTLLVMAPMALKRKRREA